VQATGVEQDPTLSPEVELLLVWVVVDVLDFEKGWVSDGFESGKMLVGILGEVNLIGNHSEPDADAKEALSYLTRNAKELYMVVNPSSSKKMMALSDSFTNHGARPSRMNVKLSVVRNPKKEIRVIIVDYKKLESTQGSGFFD
jgi:hypothetical protein